MLMRLDSVKNGKVNEFAEKGSSPRFESEARQESTADDDTQACRYNQSSPPPFVNMRNFDCLPHVGPRRRCAAKLSTYTTSPHRHLHTKCTVACRERIARMWSRLVYATMQMRRRMGTKLGCECATTSSIFLPPCSMYLNAKNPAVTCTRVTMHSVIRKR